MTKYPISILGHIDTLMALKHQHRAFSQKSDKGSCDYPRMMDLNAQFALFAIYPAKSQYNIIHGLDEWFNLLEDSKNHLSQVKSIEDIEKIKKTDNIGAILHTEGSGGFDSEFELLRLAYRLGLRTMGITHANVNRYGTGYLFWGNQEDRGITPEGRELIHEAQQLGITIDVSHLNEKSFWDVMDITEKPIMASHSNVRAICDIERNLNDKQIQKIYENHGVIGINFGTGFLNPNQNHKDRSTSFDLIKQHIDHIVNLGDISLVAMGTDFDGTTLPENLQDCTDLGRFYDFLLENGYSRSDLQKMVYDNFYRLFNATW